jgi:hypothetical protein
MVVAAAAALGLAVGGATQTLWDNPSESKGKVLAHDDSRGDEDSRGDASKDSNEDSYDGSEFQGDDESSSTNDETLVDADVLNIPDEN